MSTKSIMLGPTNGIITFKATNGITTLKEYILAAPIVHVLVQVPYIDSSHINFIVLHVKNDNSVARPLQYKISGLHTEWQTHGTTITAQGYDTIYIQGGSTSGSGIPASLTLYTQFEDGGEISTTITDTNTATATSGITINDPFLTNNYWEVRNCTSGDILAVCVVPTTNPYVVYFREDAYIIGGPDAVDRVNTQDTKTMNGYTFKDQFQIGSYYVKFKPMYYGGITYPVIYDYNYPENNNAYVYTCSIDNSWTLGSAMKYGYVTLT